VEVRVEWPKANEPGVELFLDGEPISAKKLGEPLLLRVGEHELVAKRGNTVLETRNFTVGPGDNEGTIKLPPARPVEPRRSDTGNGKTPPTDAEVVQTLIKTLKNDKDNNVRVTAAENIRKLKAREAVPALIEVLREDKNLNLLTYVLKALKELAPDKVTGALLPNLASRDSYVRSWPCTELGGWEKAKRPEERDKAVTEALVKLLRDDQDSSVRVDATVGLQRLGDRYAVDALLQVLREDKNLNLLNYVLKALKE